MHELGAIAHTGRKANELRRTRVRDLYESGLSIRQVAAHVGTSYQAVQAMLKRIGIQRRPPGGNQGSHSRHKK